MEEFPKSRRELSKEEVQDAQIGLLEWELEDREERYGLDHLTGLKTLKVFEQELERSLKMIRGEMEEHRTGVEPLKEVSLVFIDLDHFKEVNDTLGHTAGDDVLKKAAEHMKSAVRGTDLLARYGGDEFIALLPNTSEKHAVIVAEKLRATLDSDPELKKLGVTASIGVSLTNTSDATDSKPLIERADAAAYAAKKAGRNRVEMYSGV